MLNYIYILSILITTQCQTKEYEFEAYVSLIPWSGTVDEIFFRLCNIRDICGLFEAVPAGWQVIGQSYSYTYSTREDIGDIYKVQIVHPGSDALCIGHIKVNGIEYDENGASWLDWPHCIEDEHGGGCDTVTIILPTNDWNSAITVPCQFGRNLYNTYSPTPEPTTSPIPVPTKYPTITPTKLPTDTPTLTPSINPSKNPTGSPTLTPTVHVNRNRANTATTDVNLGLINSNKDDANNGAVIGGIIGGLIASAFCLCVLIVILVYCWGKKRNIKDNITEVNGRSVSAQSNIIHQPMMTEGAVTTGMSAMDMNGAKNGYHKAEDHVVMLGSKDKEKMQLIANDSSDEETDDDDDDEGMYDDDNRNMTQRLSVDDDDEDVVPNDNMDIR